MRGTAADLADKVEAAGLEGPALLMVGRALAEAEEGRVAEAERVAS